MYVTSSRSQVIRTGPITLRSLQCAKVTVTHHSIQRHTTPVIFSDSLKLKKHYTRLKMATLTLATCLLGAVGFLLACAGLGFVGFVMYVHYQHTKYAHIPAAPRQGFFAGHSPILMKYAKKNMSVSDGIVEMMRQYGPIFHMFFFFTPVIVVLDPDFVKELLCTDTHRKPYASYRPLMQVLGTRFLGSSLVTDINPDTHGPKRALLNPAFHKKYLQGQMEHFNAGADVLVKKLSLKADGKTEVVMLEELNRTTLDVIAKVAFGLELNATLGKNSPFNKAITATFAGASIARTAPWTEYSPLPGARKSRKDVRESLNFLRETGRQCIDGRLRAMERGDEIPNDILTHILKEVNGFEGDSPIDKEGLIDEFITIFIAGQETTANLLSFTLLELGNHPEVMHRLKTEVEAVVGDKDYLEYADIIQLNYMMQVLKEALRLWPPAAGTSRQMACDVTVKGYRLPKGSLVMVSTYVMSRMEEYFNNPLEFDPDRFKASDDRSQYAYFPFSLGSRNCIGQQFALIEARVLLAKLLHKFNFDLVPGQGYDVLDRVTLKPKGGCRNYLRLVE